MNKNCDNSFIIDAGRVLVNFDLDRAINKLEKFSIYGGEDIKERLFENHETNLVIAHEAGSINSIEFHKRISDLLHLNLNYDNFARIWSDIFTNNDDIRVFLDAIKECPKVILSNIDPLHWSIIKGLPNIRDYFTESECIKSFEIKLRKPQAEIYEIAKSKLPKASDIIYIDDVEEYLEVANTLGIRGIKYDCRYDSANKLIEQYAVLRKRI